MVRLKGLDGSYTTGKVKQAEMLSKGTSRIETPIDLEDVDLGGKQRPAMYVEITTGKLAKAINKLAMGKYPGSDQVRNEILKLTSPALLPILLHFFNRILIQGTYPLCWKWAET